MGYRSATVRNGFLYKEKLPYDMNGFAMRKFITKDKWKFIAKRCRQETSYFCSLCHTNFRTEAYLLDAHEVYGYDNEWAVLIDIIPACIRCHSVIHFANEKFHQASIIEINTHQDWVNRDKKPEYNELKVLESHRYIPKDSIKYFDFEYFRKYIQLPYYKCPRDKKFILQ